MEHAKAYQEFKKNGNTKFVRYSEGAELRVMRTWKWIFFPARSLTWRPWIMYRT